MLVVSSLNIYCSQAQYISIKPYLEKEQNISLLENSLIEHPSHGTGNISHAELPEVNLPWRGYPVLLYLF